MVKPLKLLENNCPPMTTFHLVLKIPIWMRRADKKAIKRFSSTGILFILMKAKVIIGSKVPNSVCTMMRLMNNLLEIIEAKISMDSSD
jgi:hypothetical protein